MSILLSSSSTIAYFKTFKRSHLSLARVKFIMTTMASQITSLTVVYSIVYSGTDQRKHQGSESPAFVFTGTGEFPVQRASNAENVSIWRRHHASESDLQALRQYHLIWHISKINGSKRINHANRSHRMCARGKDQILFRFLVYSVKIFISVSMWRTM